MHARQEVGSELEPQLVQAFVDKIDADIGLRARDRSAQHRRRRPAGGVRIAGFPGVLLVCIASVLVNAFSYASHR